MALANIAEEYFSSLNPMAARLSTDLKEIKSTYENLWETFSEDEKQQILTESIIKSDVLIKYKSKQNHVKNEYAMKIVVDDHCSYRDEHSAPFSFRTQSQRNLNIFQSEKSKGKKIVEPNSSILQKPKPAPAQDLGDIFFEMNDDTITVEVNTGLPKTGLDFLDNW
ncbi:uncharacterized protein C1orf198 homolog [Cylas formicarius]|uniref:uncharacterized protein C1orf198 homolog n=1 Tax=Cylas formicarius TaxID=197179 RepID=UPI002958D164|nr:uncharacterized protein C1orf198 homolog [Cylas formicarius]